MGGRAGAWPHWLSPPLASWRKNSLVGKWRGESMRKAASLGVRRGVGARCVSAGRRAMADLDDFHTFEMNTSHWMVHRHEAAKRIGVQEKKSWPIHDLIAASGPGNANTAQKVYKALFEIDRMLNVFEPGQLAISYNGGKDATCLLELVKAACEKHPTHKFTNVTPVWFQTPGQEFPELIAHIKETNDRDMTYTEGLKTVRDSPLSRLWTVYIANQDDFTAAMSSLATTTGIRCILMGSRRSDPGCRDISEISLLDLAPVLVSPTMTRLQLETKLNMIKVDGVAAGASTKNALRDPSLIRFSPLLEWSYRDIWDFILASRSPYCSLYDQGYSSIGTVVDTIRNYTLLKKNVEKKERAQALLAEQRPMLAHRAAHLAELNQRKLKEYKAMGVGLYDSTSAAGDFHSQFQSDPKCDYYPAWYLMDESKESASRIRTSEGSDHGMSARDQSLKDSAAVLVVCDKTVSGMRPDDKAQFMCGAIRKMGIEVKQLMIIENEIDVIAFMVRRLSPIHNYLFIVGGVGTGYEDHTGPAVAKACGVAMQKQPALLSLVLGTVPPDELTHNHLMMADVPFGAEIVGSIPDPRGVDSWEELLMDWPAVMKNNCILLSDTSLRSRMQTIKPTNHSQAGALFTSKITLCMDEGQASVHVARADTLYSDVSVHMFRSDEEDHVIVWIQSKNFDQQQNVVDSFLDKIDYDFIVEVEEEHLEEDPGCDVHPAK